MAKGDDDAKGLAIVRQFENRIVWLAAFLVNRAKGSTLNSGCAKAADEALDEYQTRFAAISVTDLPSG